MRRSALCAVVLLAGCGHPSAIPVFGAYFPGWLFCIAAGIAAALVLQAAMSRTTIQLPPLPVFLTLSTLFSLLFWLVFFRP